MQKPKWVATDVVCELQQMQIAAFGGLPGIRNEGQLESALAHPQQLYHYEGPKPSLARLAASYAFGLVKNHPFLDDNKRIGLLVAFVFLDLNGIEIRATEEDAYHVFMAFASGSCSEIELTAWFKVNSAKR